MKTEPTQAKEWVRHRKGKYYFGKVVNIIEAEAGCDIAFREGQSSPKIKQLEWEGDVLFTDIIVSDGFSLLFYRINIIDNTLHIGDMSQSFNTIEEAKAFAQSDFEARIKECLTTE